MDAARTPDMTLTDQVAVITGGGAGIGRAVALALAAVGANIVIGDIVAERGAEVVERVRELGRRAVAVPTDVTDTAQIAQLIAQADSKFGRLDILVNNAGGTRAQAFLQQSERSVRRHIDLNLVSMMVATSAAVPVMIRGGRGGTIINVASIEASRAAPRFAVYAACKAGMLSFTRTMALELADAGVRVNAIAPDFTETPGLLGNPVGPVDPTTWRTPSESERRATARRVPLGRPGVDRECGDVAVFLASSMSAYVTGTVIPVDGGTWAASGWIRNKTGAWTLTGESEP